jgi:Xaa-Pro aminopeptidase
VIEQSEYRARRERTAAALAELEVDALLVSALSNVRYLTGFTGSNAVVLLSTSSAILFTDPRYTLQAGAETSCKVVIARKPLTRMAAGVVGRKRWRRLGFERDRISFAAFMDLQEHLPGTATPVPLTGLVDAARMVKSAAEIELIRRSVVTNSRALEAALGRVKPSWTENRLAAQIDFEMRRLGAEGNAFESIVAAGNRSALPHARPTEERLGANRLLLMDIGAMQEGYASDMTRVVHLGPPGVKAKRLYKAVLEAQLAAIDAVREGVYAGAVDRAARMVLKKSGLDRSFVHSTGHGLGLEIHEGPRIGARERTRLQAGMVITIEPGAYLEDFGGVRIEDTVAVTSSGCEILTPTSKELVAI